MSRKEGDGVGRRREPHRHESDRCESISAELPEEEMRNDILMGPDQRRSLDFLCSCCVGHFEKSPNALHVMIIGEEKKKGRKEA